MHPDEAANVVALDLTDLFALRTQPALRIAGLDRYEQSPVAGVHCVLDVLPGASCAFVRTAERELSLTLPASYSMRRTTAGGWLLTSDGLPNYWIPNCTFGHRLDPDGHILVRREILPTLSHASSERIGIHFEAGCPQADGLIWRFDDPLLTEELENPIPPERHAWFLWGSHTVYTKPADLYRHLIHGWVYENRISWPKRWIICSENDAHALHATLAGLAMVSGKRIYKILQSQLAASVVARLGPDGALRHGEWSNHMEAHFRLHCSGMHLLMDHLMHGADPAVELALRRASDFLSPQHDTTELGPWFLHDELEKTAMGMDESPFNWVPSTALGKSPSNMLVLNTQIDCAIALERAAQSLGDAEQEDLAQRAFRAAAAMLELRPAEILYRLAFRILETTWIPEAEMTKLPFSKHLVRRFVAPWLQKRMHLIRTHYPRLFMPNGYVDRGVSIQGVALAYHSINLMDLLRLRRRSPNSVKNHCLRKALAFGQRCAQQDYWASHPAREYALGFWVEALWHACTMFDDLVYREWLAEGMIKLERSGMGLPPSLLGANGEALEFEAQHAPPVPADPRLRVANLARKDVLEWVVVNPAEESIALTWVTPPPLPPEWRSRTGARQHGPAALPPGEWLIFSAERADAIVRAEMT